MKFNLEETVTGADFRPNATLLTFPRASLEEVLLRLTEHGTLPDAFSADAETGTMAVFFEGNLPTLPPQVLATTGFFRFTLRGMRLTQGTGLAALWSSLLADKGIAVPLSCGDCNGITQYLAEAHRPAVEELLHKTFGIQSL